MFQIKVIEKIEAHILCSVKFSRKSYRLGANVVKYSTGGQATDGNILWRMRFAPSMYSYHGNAFGNAFFHAGSVKIHLVYGQYEETN